MNDHPPLTDDPESSSVSHELNIYTATRIGGYLLLGGNGYVDIVGPGGTRVRWYLSNQPNGLVSATVTNKISVFLGDYTGKVFLVGPIQSPRLMSGEAIEEATGQGAPINSTLEVGPHLFVVWADGYITQHLIADILNYRLEPLQKFDVNPKDDESYAEVLFQYPTTLTPVAPFQPGGIYMQIRNAETVSNNIIVHLNPQTRKMTVVPLDYTSSIFAFGTDGSVATVNHFERKLHIARAGLPLVVIDLTGPLRPKRIFPFPGLSSMGSSGFLLHDPYFKMVLPIINGAPQAFDDLLNPLISHAFALPGGGLFFTTRTNQQIVSEETNPRIPYRVADSVGAYLGSLPSAIEVDPCLSRTDCRRFLGDTSVLDPILYLP
jgi:hypothetical protein